jgi:hypothetical protein
LLIVGASALLLPACSDSTAEGPLAVKLGFTLQPIATTAGAPIGPPVAVAIEDAAGNTVTSATDVVTVALGANPGGGTLTGTTSAAAVNGVATFSDLSINRAGSGYALTAYALRTSLSAATSAHFDITPGSPSQLGFAVQPGNGVAGGVITPPVQVVAQDAFGNTATQFTGKVTVALGANPSGATLSGTTEVNAVNGVATFSSLSIDKASAGYTLTASFGTLAGATSAPFAIAAAPALHVTTVTTGSSIPTGYDLCVDFEYTDYEGSWDCATYYSFIGATSDETVSVTPGTHSIQLLGVPGNCTVSEDNPRTVTVSAGMEVPFGITCEGVGTVRVTIATTGTDVDPEGYRVCVAGPDGACGWDAETKANDAVTLSGVLAGPYTVSLYDVGGNCTVAGGMARAVIVPLDGTVNVAFDVSCVLAERIAFHSDASGTINVVHADGAADHQITSGAAPAWSADGARLAYECGQNLCVVNADGSGYVQLTHDAASNQHPSWSPDGSRIAFSAIHGGVPDLYVIYAKGAGFVRLTQNVGFLGGPAWSPDGARIAFDCQVDPGNPDICAVNADGSGFTRLTSHPAPDYGPAWKPDGSSLAFTTTRYSASDEIAVLNISTASVTRIGAGLQGSEPSWSPTGTQLAFVVYEGCYDYECSEEYYIHVAQTDGSNISIVAGGRQPAWKPHP